MTAKQYPNPILLFRALQAILAIITLALFGSVAAWYNSNSVSASDTTPMTNVPGAVAYAVFIPVLTILITLPYVLLAPRFFPTLAHRHAILAIECVTQILWFASWVASAAFLGNLSVCRGGICTAAKVGVVFATFEWITFLVTTVFAVRYCLWWSEGQMTDVSDGNSIRKNERRSERGLKGVVGKLHGAWVGMAPSGRQHEDNERVMDIRHPGQF